MGSSCDARANMAVAYNVIQVQWAGFAGERWTRAGLSAGRVAKAVVCRTLPRVVFLCCSRLLTAQWNPAHRKKPGSEPPGFESRRRLSVTSIYLTYIMLRRNRRSGWTAEQKRARARLGSAPRSAWNRLGHRLPRKPQRPIESESGECLSVQHKYAEPDDMGEPLCRRRSSLGTG